MISKVVRQIWWDLMDMSPFLGMLIWRQGWRARWYVACQCDLWRLFHNILAGPQESMTMGHVKRTLTCVYTSTSHV